MEEKGHKKRATFTINKDVLEALRVDAFNRRCSMSSVVQEALEDYLEEDESPHEEDRFVERESYYDRD